MRLQQEKSSFFDVSYSIPSLSITTGNTTIATTPSDYWGYAILVSSAPVTMIVYNSSTALGVIVDIVTVTTSTRVMNLAPVKARVGLSVNMTGTNGKATIFYTPKG